MKGFNMDTKKETMSILERDILKHSSDILHAMKRKNELLDEYSNRLYEASLSLEEVQSTVDDLLTYDKFIYMKLGSYWTTMGVLDNLKKSTEGEDGSDE